MFGINGGEFLVILLVAVIVIGPSRLPKYAEQLAVWTKQARRFVQDARKKVDDELGDEIKDIDWQALDPRRYDPRRIVRDALLEPDPPAKPGPASAARPARTLYQPPAPGSGAGSAASTARAAVGAGTAQVAATPGALATPAPAAAPTIPAAEAVDVEPTTPYDDEAT